MNQEDETTKESLMLRSLKTPFAAGAFLALTSLAQPALGDTDARDYPALETLPNNTQVFLAYYRHITSTDTTNLSENLFLARYLFITKKGHWAFAPIDFVFPVADVTVYVPTMSSGGPSSAISQSGVGDLTYAATAVYMYPESEGTSTVFGASGYLSIPTGQYDRDHAINIGAHRWFVKSELYAGQLFAKKYSVEVLANEVSYTTNDDYSATLSTGAARGSYHQKPTLGFEAHTLADVADYFSVGVSYYATANGRALFEGQEASLTEVPNQVIQSLRFTGALRIEKQSLILFQYQNDVAASEGASIGRFFGVRVSHFF